MNESTLADALDIKSLSKKEDPEGRNEVAQEVNETRKLDRETKDTEAKIEELSQAISQSWDLERQKESEITNRTQELIFKLKEILGVNDKKIDELTGEIQDIKDDREKLRAKVAEIELELEKLKLNQADVPRPRELVDAYYEKMAHSPLTQEQKRRLLNPEALSQLSTEQYIALWKRLNPYFMSHSTRQGFRDHNAMQYHSRGLQEFHAGFEGIIQDDGLIRPPIAVESLRHRDEASIKRWLGDYVFEGNKEEAYHRLDRLLYHNPAAEAPKYPDMTAVHFSTQIVPDEYYGGERGNEVFFVYPSDVLASQHDFAFNGWERDFTKPQSETKWNDVFVWPQQVENAGISIDAGLVFLPKSSKVDRQTGSKYASDMQLDEAGIEKRTMVEDQHLIESFVSWLTSIHDKPEIIDAFKRYNEETNYYDQTSLRQSVIQIIKSKLVGLGFTDDNSFRLSNEIVGEMYRKDEFNDEDAESIIRSSGAHYKMAEDTVTAQEYWEAYFQKNPEIKPKHVIYYDGSPTRAVIEFQRSHGIGGADTTAQDGSLLGFDDHHVESMESDERANRGKQELYDTALKIIEEHYADQPQPESTEVMSA